MRIEENRDGTFTVKALIDYSEYEGRSRMMPVGPLGLAEVKKLLEYVKDDISWDAVGDSRFLTVPMPFGGGIILVQLNRVDPVVTLQKNIQKILIGFDRLGRALRKTAKFVIFIFFVYLLRRSGRRVRI